KKNLYMKKRLIIMSKMKLRVTVHAIVREDYTPCNFDCSWLFNHPSTLLWADKIIITPFMDEVIDSESYPDNRGLSKSLKEIFDTARDYDLIEVKDPTKILNSDLADQVSNEIERDRKVLPELFPDDIKIDEINLPGAICTDESEFCEPYLWSIYGNLILSKKWNAQCLFSDHIMNFLQYKFGSSLVNTKGIKSVSQSFNTIFNPILPEYNIYGNMLGYKCGDCDHLKKCEKKSLPKLRNDLSKYLDLRDYDELNQLKKVLWRIIKSVPSKNSFDHEDIINEFKNEERSTRKMMRSTFPKVKRWANISLMASIPITMVGLYTGLPVVSAIGASAVGISKYTEKYVKHLESKNNWIGFKINDL
ncbi:MAG: hypothetical protein K8E24_012415, partial [Methanobacterium paludis]|nr:hypothetical protein [Methanobacterium paludis]